MKSLPTVDPIQILQGFLTGTDASQKANFGAQVLHPIAMQPAMKYDVPVRVKNSYNPQAEGTVIKNRDGPAPRAKPLFEKCDMLVFAKVPLLQVPCIHRQAQRGSWIEKSRGGPDSPATLDDSQHSPAVPIHPSWSGTYRN